jgi:hypothetical protein
VISGLQIRAARAFLVWDRRDLARWAVVLLSVIERIEMGEKITGTLAKAMPVIQAALEAAGIEFLNGDEPGIKLRAKTGKGKWQA